MVSRHYVKWTIEKMKEESKRDGTYFLSEEYHGVDTKYAFKCPLSDHSSYRMSWNNFHYKGQRCPKCKGEKLRLARRLPYQRVKEQIESAEGYCLLSKEYVNAYTKLEIKCPRGDVFWATRDKFVNGGHRCPFCNESKGERAVAVALDALGIKYVRRQKIEGTRFELDFFLPLVRCGIEYDGEQHFRPVPFCGSSMEKAQKEFEKTKKRDIRKNQLCKEKNIKLIRISYVEEVTITSLEDKMGEALCPK